MNKIENVRPTSNQGLLVFLPEKYVERKASENSDIILPATSNPDSSLILATIVAKGPRPVEDLPKQQLWASMEVGQRIWVIEYDGKRLPNELNNYAFFELDKVYATEEKSST